MLDIAMHILELLMNSIQAMAKVITVRITDSEKDDLITIEETDDGKGMSKELLERVTDPFTTTRTTRKVGLGVAFMKGMTEQCGGTFDIQSTEGVGTKIKATAQRSNIDTPDMGDIGQMMMAAIQANEDIDYILEYKTDTNSFVFKSSEIREQLAGVSLLEPEILIWIKEYINQGIKQAKEDLI